MLFDDAPLFAEVLLPVPLDTKFTYRVPHEFISQVAVGKRVVVQFGKRKVLTGIISKLHSEAQKELEYKCIVEVIDEEASVLPSQLAFWQWLASYYLCSIGEVVDVALPSGLKLSSETLLQLHPLFSESNAERLSPAELQLVEALKTKESIPLSFAADLLRKKNFFKSIKDLVNREIVLVFEQVKEKYQPKLERRIRLNPLYAKDVDQLQALFETLQKKPKQEDLLLRYVQLSKVLNEPSLNDHGLAAKELLKEGMSQSSLDTLIKNGVFESYTQAVSRFGPVNNLQYKEIVLSALQENAFQQIRQEFLQKDCVLLHGITGSGKTEVFCQLAKQVIEAGSQVLLLLPEIALTTQMVMRLRSLFGNAMLVYHSKYSDNERVEVWNAVLTGACSLVVGVRSALFLPFQSLSLIVVDEEHEPSYKQADPAPRYQARDAAVVLAKQHKAKVLLCSATPSLESYYNAKNGRYGLVSMDQRFGEAQLPSIKLLNIAQQKKDGLMQHEFSKEALDEMLRLQKQGKQSLVFQNKRGYASFLLCELCSWIPECPNCSVSLNFHLYNRELKCHYCGYRKAAPYCCEQCGGNELKSIGTGTEKLEEHLSQLLPNVSVGRMDQDSTRGKTAHERIINDFQQGNYQVLVGTQMISKGLDFENVQLVLVPDADRVVGFPDFRAQERGYQLLTQVSGRAGRREEKGLVLIQTRDPKNPIFSYVIEQNYDAFYQREIVEREKFAYPPFVRLIRVICRHVSAEECQKTATLLAHSYRQVLGSNKVLGPSEPFVSKVNLLYIREILIKIERNFPYLEAAKKEIARFNETWLKQQGIQGMRVILDVDPN